MEQVFWIDKIVPTDNAAVSIADSSFLYGLGLFETLRACGGKVFRIQDHIDRLLNSAAALGVPCGLTADFIENAVGQVLEANGLKEARMRMTLSGGPLAQADTPTGTLLITATEFTPYPKEYYDKGVRVILTDFRQNSKDPTCGHKTTCYAPRLLALKKAHEKLATEALWFTTENKLAEGCISNIFLVKDNTLYTPTTDTPVLSGIARRTVLELAQKKKIKAVEQDLTIHDLLSAQEVFMTNVIMTLLPVTSIESHSVDEGKVGPITKELTEAYEEKLKGKR
jgi:branched-subunit amino acid aminotransferase/4-amino-4-deoxychorismate lyase